MEQFSLTVGKSSTPSMEASAGIISTSSSLTHSLYCYYMAIL